MAKIKIPNSRVWSWIKEHKWLFLIITLFVLISFDSCKSYFSPIVYEVMVVSRNASDPLSTNYILGIRFTTKKAFIPFEKIDIEAVVEFNSDYESRIKGHEFFVTFEESYDYQKWKNKEKASRGIRATNFLVEIGSVTFLPTDRPHIYTGKTSIIFKRPGKFDAASQLDDIRGGNLLGIPIEIGTTVDVMNKKTNDLLYMLTVLNIILVFYNEFKIKSQQPISN